MTGGLPFSLLLVDDDEDDRIFIDDAFLKLGYDAEVKKFKDIPGLFHYLKSISDPLLPSLIVLDSRIAELDAHAIVKSIYAEERYRSIPIVIYASMLSPAKQKELLAMGVYACLEKGENMEETLQLAKQLKQIAQSRPVSPKA